MAAVTPVRTIIFDIGDVLCTWSAQNTTSIPRQLLKEFRSSPTWYEYDCGRIGEQECYAQLAARFSVPASEISAAFAQARDSQAPNETVIAAIKELRAAHKGLRVYAMSNISRPDWEILRSKAFDWSIFDRVFTSNEAGMRKPELRFYRHVLDTTGTAPGEAVFVDDKADNVLAARSLGFRDSIVFDDAGCVRRQLLNILGNPAERGNEYVTRNARKTTTVTDSGHPVPDNFSQLLLLEATGNKYGDRPPIPATFTEPTDGVIGISSSSNGTTDLWNYFIGRPFGTTRVYPDDVDTTSYAMKLLPIDSKVSHSIMDEMVSPRRTTADGIVMVYFDDMRDRTDPAVCVNVVRCYYQHGRGNQAELQATKNWICDTLFHRGYVDGTRYYHSPDVFLYFFARLLAENPESDMYRGMAALLRERLRERVNTDADALALAMRILACHLVGVRDDGLDLARLLRLQQEDGGWETGWLCRYGKTGIRLGNRVLTSALAVQAVLALRPAREKVVLVAADDVRELESAASLLRPTSSIVVEPTVA